MALLACVTMMAALRAGAESVRPNDFPTVERVLFVEACARDHPERARTEMLYKCSCALDSIAAELSYAEYVDASTAFAAGQDLAGRYREARANARKRCMLP